MEASEKIVEAYMRSVKKCLTIANIKCWQNKEIDLLAIDPEGEKYHIESSIKTSPSFSKLTDKKLSEVKSKPAKRMTLEFFEKEKFNHFIINDTLKEYGFVGDNYDKVIVAMRVSPEVEQKALSRGMKVWRFGNIVMELFDSANRSEYLSAEDRIFQLMNYVLDKQGKTDKNF